MDFVKREDQNVIDEENYKLYLENLQKSHLMEPDYQHTQISMEQLHQAMQSSLTNNIVQNLPLQLSPRQMSTLMLRTNHLARNDLPAHLRTIEMDLAHNLNELQHLRHDDLLAHNFNRNLDLSLVRNMSDIDLQAGLTQTLMQNLTDDIHLTQRSDLSNELQHEIDLSDHLNRQHVQDLIEHEKRTPMVIQCVPDTHLLDPVGQRIDQNRLEQSLHRIDNTGHRVDYSIHRIDDGQRVDESGQRLDDPGHRLDDPGHRLGDPGQRVDQIGQRLSMVSDRPNDHDVMPMQFIKSEQEDEYFYDNINHGLNNVDGINGHILPDQHMPVPTDNQLYSIYPPQTNVPNLNSVDLYRNFPQNFTRENPQNLVVNRPYTNYHEEIKKINQNGRDKYSNDELENGGIKIEEPKENLKPNDNKLFYNEGEKDKLSEEVNINIKGVYLCYKCNEVFPSKRGLKQHSKSCTDTESSEKVGKFGCSQCAYRCQSPAILKIHERTHSGEKPFSCNFCDYKSGQKNNVAKHILVHMKEKPFRCQYCDYKCAQKNNLVVHERTHTGYKPFACNFCEYRTVQKPNLVKHMYLHTDQKPFSCDICNYRCVQKTNLTKHKQRHFNERENSKLIIKEQLKPYRPRQKSVKCPHCPYKCVQKSSMEKHMQFKHNGDGSTDINEESIQNLSVKKNFADVTKCEFDKEPIQS